MDNMVVEMDKDGRATDNDVVTADNMVIDMDNIVVDMDKDGEATDEHVDNDLDNTEDKCMVDEEKHSHPKFDSIILSSLADVKKSVEDKSDLSHHDRHSRSAGNFYRTKSRRG